VRWKGVKWFIEGDICAFFDSLRPEVLVQILAEQIHDNRFLRLVKQLLAAGYMEAGVRYPTTRGTPQGSGLSPVLSNLMLDRLDKYVERELLPAYTRGQRRKAYRPYGALVKAAWDARQRGEVERARALSKHAQTLPSHDPYDPTFRRLWYTRYCDDFLLGFVGPKAEAALIKRQLAAFLHNELGLELSEEKTLITHARTEKAHFLGYELHTFQANDKHDRRGRRCVNGGIGLCVPTAVIHAHCALYRNGQRSRPFLQRVHDSAYTIVTQYQAEYRGIVEYYRLAYNLRRLQRLKWVMESSLTRTLAMKFKTSCRTIHQRLQTVHHTKDGTYKVLEVQVDRGPQRPPLVARFGGITLRWNRQAPISELPPKPIWSGRSEVVERLLAETCEVCGATDDIEVHHLRKLSDLDRPGHAPRPKWVKIMATRRRKTLVVCQACHHAIHSGRYDGPALSAKTHGRAD
jgi:hypothetical protein